MKGYYNILKKGLLEAIANDWQGRALENLNAAYTYCTIEQARELQSIYDAWEKTWANLS